MYKKMYLVLAGAVADAIEQLEAHRYPEAMGLLEWASQQAEEIYISQDF